MMRSTGFIKASFLAGGMLIFHLPKAQELFVFTEPASNMPAKSFSPKLTARFVKDHSGNIMQRYTPELMLGVNKNWMVHAASSFSDMYSAAVRLESARLYAKYRFFSIDEVHTHFRVAAFAEIAKSRNKYLYNELSLQGDHSGAQTGIILTQLWNKLAVSSTLGYLLVTTPEPEINSGKDPRQAFEYSLSAGYLVLPVNYTSFKQTNLNVYAELLGQQTIDKKNYVIDFAPALQLIFNSVFKLNAGYRFQIAGNSRRMARQGFSIGVERTFLNILK